MADIIGDDGPPKKKIIPEPKGDKETPEVWAAASKNITYRTAMLFAGIALTEEITKDEFDRAVEDYKKVPGNWHKNIPMGDLKDAVKNPSKYKKYWKVVK